MDFMTIIVVASSICGIMCYLFELYMAKYIQSRKWLWIIVAFVLTFCACYVVYYESELRRINDIHRHAQTIYEQYTPTCSHMAYIQEMLTFLEENKDRYPDAYVRATEIYARTQNAEIFDIIDATVEMRGIVKGIATLNE